VGDFARVGAKSPTGLYSMGDPPLIDHFAIKSEAAEVSGA